MLCQPSMVTTTQRYSLQPLLQSVTKRRQERACDCLKIISMNDISIIALPYAARVKHLVVYYNTYNSFYLIFHYRRTNNEAPNKKEHLGYNDRQLSSILIRWLKVISIVQEALNKTGHVATHSLGECKAVTPKQYRTTCHIDNIFVVSPVVSSSICLVLKNY